MGQGEVTELMNIEVKKQCQFYYRSYTVCTYWFLDLKTPIMLDNVCHTMSAEARGPRLGQKEIISEGFVFGMLQCSGILNLQRGIEGSVAPNLKKNRNTAQLLHGMVLKKVLSSCEPNIIPLQIRSDFCALSRYFKYSKCDDDDGRGLIASFSPQKIRGSTFKLVHMDQDLAICLR